jgi:hypothetical protein
MQIQDYLQDFRAMLAMFYHSIFLKNAQQTAEPIQDGVIDRTEMVILLRLAHSERRLYGRRFWRIACIADSGAGTDEVDFRQLSSLTT